ncbi:MAG: type II/IV secretion system ATPase subunit [Nanoarchaeota archaeon]
MSVPINLNPKIPALPKLDDKTKIDIRYMLIAPYASAHIYWDTNLRELVYDLEEPMLTPGEKEILDRIEEAMYEVINVNVAIEKTVESTSEYVDKTARIIIEELDLKVSEQSYSKMFYYLFRDFIGLQSIEPLMKDYYIEDIECNGIDTPVYLIHRMYRNMRTNIKFRNVDELASFVEKLAQKTGRYISYAQPLLDGTLPDGSRINASYTKDVTSKGPTFTIRKFTKIPWTPIQILANETMSPEMLAYFWILLQYKSSILITGGTGSGKTTLLNAIAFFIPPEARVVSLEDTREINLPRENWLPAVARPSIGVGKVGEIDLFSLLKSSFRQNPDYLIVGEVRGQEASVLFQGMASGHSSMSTMHAESVDTLIRRLQTPPISLSPTLINSLDCVAVVTHVNVGGKESRKVKEIVEIVDVNQDGQAVVNTPMSWDPYKNQFFFKKQSKVFERIAKQQGLDLMALQREWVLRAKVLQEMYKKKIMSFEEVGQVINEYYKDPAGVLQKFGIQ